MIRKLFIVLIMVTLAGKGFAQETPETVVKKNWLTESVREIFHVLKSDKETKQGIYQAVYTGNMALASGMYTNNKRTGTWHFYDTGGHLIENFDYDSLTILYEEPTGGITDTKIAYGFDTPFTDSDRVTKPIKPGGRCFGYINYLKLYKISQDMYGIDLSQYVSILEVLVSPGGRLADIKIHLKTFGFERTTTFSTELLSDEDKIFIPATINQQPVMSRIFIRCKITPYGDLDVD